MASQLGSKEDEADPLMHDEIGSETMLYNITNFFSSALEIQDSEQGLFDVGAKNELTMNDVGLERRINYVIFNFT